MDVRIIMLPSRSDRPPQLSVISEKSLGYGYCFDYRQNILWSTQKSLLAIAQTQRNTSFCEAPKKKSVVGRFDCSITRQEFCHESEILHFVELQKIGAERKFPLHRQKSHGSM